ncbi:MAG: FtsX-like permease family protein [Planctomycetota bacterium]
MRLMDLFSLAWKGLIQNKIRFLLTMLGVTVGTFGLVLLLAVGQGLQNLLLKQFQEGDQLKQVIVIPGFGKSMSKKEIEQVQWSEEIPPEKRERLNRAMSLRKHRGPSQQFYTVPISAEVLEEVEKFPSVDLIEPVCQDSYQIILGKQQKDRILGMGLSERNQTFKERILFGRYFTNSTAKEVLLHEYLLYQFGYITEEQILPLLGQELEISYLINSNVLAQNLSFLKEEGLLDRIEFFKQLSTEQKQKVFSLFKELEPVLDSQKTSPQEQILFTEKLKIVGVLKEASRQSGSMLDHGMSLHADIFFPIKFATDLYLRVPANRQRGFSAMRVQAKTEQEVNRIERFIEEKGFKAYSMKSVLQRIDFALSGVTVFVGVLAGIALLVATLGIANTMIMSVLERTREIGIMKAIGAQDWHIRGIFFLESSYIGIVGGALGILLSIAMSFPLEYLGKEYIREKAKENLDLDLLYFPGWLIGGAFLFAWILSMVAAWLPSRRASRVDPIETLRHE